MKKLLKNVTGELSWGVRRLCGKPSPMKRFVMVLIIGGALGTAFLYTFVDAIYSIAKNDAKKEFLELEHIKRLNFLEDSMMSNRHIEPKDTLQQEIFKNND